MIITARQLKDLIRNLSKKKSADYPGIRVSMDAVRVLYQTVYAEGNGTHD